MSDPQPSTSRGRGRGRGHVSPSPRSPGGTLQRQPSPIQRQPSPPPNPQTTHTSPRPTPTPSRSRSSSVPGRFGQTFGTSSPPGGTTSQAQPPPPQQWNAVSGSQLNTIPIFKGDRSHEDIELWIDHVERAAKRCRWSPEATAGAALTRMEGAAAQWIRACEKRRRNIEDWPHLKQALMTDFAEPLNNLAAARAVLHLQQKPKEDVQTFFDRVVLAIDRKNFNYSEAEKTTAAYQEAQDKDIYMFFAAGLREEFRDRALTGLHPPTDADGLLAAARNIEKELYRARAPDITVAEIPVEEKPEPTLQEQIAALTAEIAALRPNFGAAANQDRSNVTCFYCEKKGHYKRDCFKFKRDKENKRVKPGTKRPSSGKNFGRKKKKKASGKSRLTWKVQELQPSGEEDTDVSESENSEEEA